MKGHRQKTDQEIGDPGGSPGNATLPSGEVQGKADPGNPRHSRPYPGRVVCKSDANGLPIEWHSRGYLPHYDAAKKIQHVTLHLADSLPHNVIIRLRKEVESLPAEKQQAACRKRVEDWMDAGHGCCILREPKVAGIVQSALLFFDGKRYRVMEWVIMPNHVHVLFQPLPGHTTSGIVASWKKFTARRIREWAGRADREIGDPGNKGADREIGDPGGSPGNATLPSGASGFSSISLSKSICHQPVWHREYWDRFIRNEEHLENARDYIRNNPVKAGLVQNSAEWPWSSAASNATLPRGNVREEADREIGDPSNQKADREIGDPSNQEADQEIGDAGGSPGNATLPSGEVHRQQPA